MPNRTGQPLRLKPKRLTGYSSFYGFPPRDMVASYGDFSWQDRLVLGTDFSEAPLFWTIESAARSLAVSPDGYISRGYAACLPSRPRPTVRPSAVIYANTTDGIDFVPGAVAPIIAALKARGVFVGRAWPFGAIQEGDDPSNLAPGAHGFTCPHGLPWQSMVIVHDESEELGGLWTADRPDASVPPVEGGPTLYVSVWNEHATVNTQTWFIDEGVGWVDLPNLFDHDRTFMDNQGLSHDRCLYYSVYCLNGSAISVYDGVTGDDKAVMRLADMASATPYFGWDTVNGSIADTGVQAAITDLITAKVKDFFSL